MALTLVKEKPLRRFPSWIESFLEATSGLPVPKIFLKWTAISAIAGALERKVWVRMNKMNLYPNMYVLLIGGPGVGKTVSARQAEILWRGTEFLHVAPTSVTKASLIDVLNDSHRQIPNPTGHPDFFDFHGLTLYAGEFGSLLPMYDNEFMNTLTTLWDCDHYAERRRTGDRRVTIPSPVLNMLACTTPDYMNHFMPEGAWQQGFISRVMMIYSGETVLGDLFHEDDTQHENSMGRFYPDLLHDMKQIGEMMGKMEYAPAAAAAFTDWYKKSGPPVPSHGKLSSYIPRRTVHLAKLTMVAAAQRDTMTIDLEAFQWALDTLLEAEHLMPDIFRAMGGQKGDSAAMEEAWTFAYKHWGTKKTGVPKHIMVAFLSERVPNHSVLNILSVMVQAQMLREELSPGAGLVYFPAPKGKLY